MKKLRFTDHYPPYNSGETATFPDDVADRYVKAGVAKVVTVTDDKKPDDKKS